MVTLAFLHTLQPLRLDSLATRILRTAQNDLPMDPFLLSAKESSPYASRRSLSSRFFSSRVLIRNRRKPGNHRNKSANRRRWFAIAAQVPRGTSIRSDDSKPIPAASIVGNVSAVAPGERVPFTVTFPAPAAPGNYRLELRISNRGQAFEDFSPDIPMVVTP
jgi:hypothetical protein